MKLVFAAKFEGESQDDATDTLKPAIEEAIEATEPLLKPLSKEDSCSSLERASSARASKRCCKLEASCRGLGADGILSSKCNKLKFYWLEDYLKLRSIDMIYLHALSYFFNTIGFGSSNSLRPSLSSTSTPRTRV